MSLALVCRATGRLAIPLIMAGVPAAAQSPPLQGLDRFVARSMADWQVPGLALGVVKDDSVVLIKGYGVRRAGSSEPVDENTIFAIGSAGKAFTTAALAILADEGRLAWDDRAIDRLPEFQLADSHLTRSVLIRDLVTHRTGLPGGRANLLFFGGGYTRTQILERVRYLEPRTGIRAEFQYQNLMFLAAGEVVARVAGSSWDDFVRDRLFIPLGMTSTSTSIRAFADRTNVAQPTAVVRGEARSLPWRNIDNIGPAGSINSTARDMTAWLRLHLGKGRFGGKQIISQRNAEELRTPQIILPPSRMGSMNAIHQAGAASLFFTYGLGWVVFDYRGRRVMWHGGNIDGMAAVVAMMPDEGLGLVVLTNLDGNTLRDAIMLRIFDAYLGAPERDWSTELLAVARRDAAGGKSNASAPTAAPGRPHAEYTGRYEERLLGGMTVKAEGQRLRFELETGLVGSLESLGGDRFRARWDDPGIAVVVSSLDQAVLGFSFDGTNVVAEFEGVGRFTRVRPTNDN
jgi:CubicO group peptidase (beta-lactamase class C family)